MSEMKTGHALWNKPFKDEHPNIRDHQRFSVSFGWIIRQPEGKKGIISHFEHHSRDVSFFLLYQHYYNL